MVLYKIFVSVFIAQYSGVYCSVVWNVFYFALLYSSDFGFSLPPILRVIGKHQLPGVLETSGQTKHC